MAGRKPRLSTPSGPGLGGKPNELSDVRATVGRHAAAAADHASVDPELGGHHC